MERQKKADLLQVMLELLMLRLLRNSRLNGLDIMQRISLHFRRGAECLAGYSISHPASRRGTGSDLLRVGEFQKIIGGLGSTN